MPFLDRLEEQKEHFESNDMWSDIEKTEKLYVPIPPKAIEYCFKIEKINGSKVLITYAIAPENKDEIVPEDES